MRTNPIRVTYILKRILRILLCPSVTRWVCSQNIIRGYALFLYIQNAKLVTQNANKQQASDKGE